MPLISESESSSMDSKSTLVLTSNNVLLPGHKVTQPATIAIDTSTGKIIDIQLDRNLKAPYGIGAQFIDVGDRYILPGLVESVHRPIIHIGRLIVFYQCPRPFE